MSCRPGLRPGASDAAGPNADRARTESGQTRGLPAAVGASRTLAVYRSRRSAGKSWAAWASGPDSWIAERSVMLTAMSAGHAWNVRTGGRRALAVALTAVSLVGIASGGGMAATGSGERPLSVVRAY